MELAKLVIKLVADAKKARDELMQFAGGVGQGMGNLGKSFLKFTAVGALALTTIFGLMGGFDGLRDATIGAAISVESAFAGVIKTTDGLADSAGNLTVEGAALKQELIDISKIAPVTPEEAMAVAELAGQMGVAKDEIAGYTETVLGAAEATNLTVETASTGFAQLGNIFNVESSEMAENASRTGSAIVALGNNYATTESDILNMTKRMAVASSQADISEADTLGLAAALSSLGIPAEAGGTAISNAFNAISSAVAMGGEDLATFAETSGLSADEFSAMWQEDAMGAFQAFTGGLNDAGADAIGILDDVGLGGIRSTSAMLGLANSGEVLSDALDTANSAFDENAALAKEVAQRYATTESKMDIFKNKISAVGLQIGEKLMPFLNQLIDVAGPLIEEYGGKLVAAFDEILPVVVELATGFGTFVTETLVPFVQEHGPALVSAFLAIGAVLAAAGIISTIMGLVAAFNPVTLAIAGILAVVGLLGFAWSKNWGGIREKFAAVWAFLKPILMLLFNFFQTTFKLAIEKLTEIWNTVLMPAFEAMGAFIDDTLMPILSALWTIIEISLGLAFDVLGQILNDVIIPVLKDLFKWFNDKIMPVVRDVVSWLRDKLEPAFKGIAKMVESVVDWLEDLVETLKELEVPDLFTPGSPTPFERGLAGIGKAAKELAGMRLPALQMAMGKLPDDAMGIMNPSFAGAAPGGFVGGNGGPRRMITFEKGSVVLADETMLEKFQRWLLDEEARAEGMDVS